MSKLVEHLDAQGKARTAAKKQRDRDFYFLDAEEVPNGSADARRVEHRNGSTKYVSKATLTRLARGAAIRRLEGEYDRHAENYSFAPEDSGITRYAYVARSLSGLTASLESDLALNQELAD